MHWQSQTIWFTIVFVLYSSIWCRKQSYDMTMEKIQFHIEPGVDIFDESNLHLMGPNRVINGSVELKVDVDDEHYEISVDLYSDTSGNGDFRRLPYNISNVRPCAAIREYGEYCKPSLQQGVNTNFPVDGDLCPIPKNIYYFNDVKVSTDNLPNQVPRGFLKGVLSLYKDGEYLGGLEVLVRVEDKYY